MSEIVRVRLSLQHTEDFVDIFNDLLVRSQQPFVRIDAGRFLVKVARAQVSIAFQGVIGIIAALAHISQLCVHLQSRQTVDDLYPGLLHQFGGEVVVLLIEAGLQLNEDSHLLAIFCCADKTVDHG